MSCEFYQGLLIDQIAGELSEEDEVRIEQHLAECDDCTLEGDRLRKVTRAVLPAGRWEASERVEARLVAELQKRYATHTSDPTDPSQVRSGFGGWLFALFGQPSRAFASVTAVVCAIAIGFLLGQWRESPRDEVGRSPQAQPVRQQIETSTTEGRSGLADRLGAIDDSLNRGGGSWAGRGWIQFATTPSDAISLAESFPTDTL